IGERWGWEEGKKLGGLAQLIKKSAGWDDVVIPELQKKKLSKLVGQVRDRLKVYETWGFVDRGRSGVGVPGLFTGCGGTGTTMAAEVLARELRLDLYRIDLSSVVSKYIGETEKNLKQVFDAAEEGFFFSSRRRHTRLVSDWSSDVCSSD